MPFRPALPETAYPETHRARAEWVLRDRGPRAALDPDLPYLVLAEAEPDDAGTLVPVAALFLTNRECPFRCVMCDLWRNTLDQVVPPGAILRQVREGLARVPSARWVKLYNAGSYFDPLAIPPQDDSPVLALLAGRERVIVESHPGFVRQRCREFAGALAGEGSTLEVAMGLETANEAILDRLNKRMTLDTFRAAVGRLRGWGARVRAFILVRPPWMTEAEGVDWGCRSLEFAFTAGVQTCSLIPTRGGTAAMARLAATGEFAPPRLSSVEQVMAHGLALGRGRVFVDLWDIEPLAECPACGPEIVRRMARANLEQVLPGRPACAACGE